jgi:hypothetical protein
LVCVPLFVRDYNIGQKGQWHTAKLTKKIFYQEPYRYFLIRELTLNNKIQQIPIIQNTKLLLKLRKANNRFSYFNLLLWSFVLFWSDILISWKHSEWWHARALVRHLVHNNTVAQGASVARSNASRHHTPGYSRAHARKPIHTHMTIPVPFWHARAGPAILSHFALIATK